MNVNGNTVDELIFAVDGRISHVVSNTATITANLGIGVDAIADQASITSSFVGGGSTFVTNGIDPSPVMLRAGLGLVMYPTANLEIVTRYDLEARQDFISQTASIKLRLPF